MYQLIIILGDYIIVLSVIDRTSRQKQLIKVKIYKHDYHKNM